MSYVMLASRLVLSLAMLTACGEGAVTGNPDAAQGLDADLPYYVATTGSDSNAGTEALPWRTIQKAADTVSVQGFAKNLPAAERGS